MIDLGPHAIFIVAGWGGAAAAVIGLVGATIYRARAARARLAALEAQGIRRRSGGRPA